ncbi:MAG: fumarylacetoacetate hydrolase family protein [Nannocystaceae bacterium]|nr:fumarylacetoacetate hydrolase family protein [Nannocystaceae bacterium]
MSTSWLGRVRMRDERKSHPVRVVTDGRAPAAEDSFDILRDPFDDELWPEHIGSVWERLLDDDNVVQRRAVATVADARVLAPCRPGKVLCVGRNYRAHAAEMGNAVPTEPLMFHKPASAVIGSEQDVVIPPGFDRVDMESELVAVIGRRGRNITAQDGLAHIAGYTLGNDVSNRDLQRGDKLWTRGKGFDTFAPLGPWVRVTEPGQALPADARIQGRLDGELLQDAPLGDMVFDISAVLAFISACMTLEPGDVLYTGTPQGVSALRPGQMIEVSLQGFELGTLRNPTA